MAGEYKNICVANLDTYQGDYTPVYVVNFDSYPCADKYVRIINFDTPDPRPGSYEQVRIINFEAQDQQPSGYERVYVINPEILLYFGFSPEGLVRSDRQRGDPSDCQAGAICAQSESEVCDGYLD
jgi:DNA-binding beta-propeller fold protein YncE